MKYCVQLEFCHILYEILRAVGTCVVVGAMVGREELRLLVLVEIC